MKRLHHPECVCSTCEALHIGAFAYRDVAEELGSDDPVILDPVWRTRCQARVDAYNDTLRREHERHVQSERPVPLLACFVEPDRWAA